MRWRRRRSERGSITPFVAIVALALLFLGALVIDGSRQLSARAQAVAYAEEAARAAAQKIDPTKGPAVLVKSDADAAVSDYCSAAQAVPDSNITSCEMLEPAFVEGNATSQLASVTVVVEVTYDPIMLDMIPGFSSQYEVKGEATAHPIQGILEPELELFTPPTPVVDTRPVDANIPVGDDRPTEGEIPTPTPTETCRSPGDPPPPRPTCEPNESDPTDGPGPDGPGPDNDRPGG